MLELWLVGAAIAADDVLTEALLAQAGVESTEESGPPPRRREILHELNLRYRYLVAPDFLIDPFAYGSDDVHPTTGEVHPERPKVRAMAFGLEYVVNKSPLNGIFYFEYMPSLTEAGYWDDIEDDNPDFYDGDYVVPVDLALYNIGANFGFEAEPSPYVHFLFTAGLGLAIRSGELENWNSEDGVPAYLRYEQNPDSPDELLDVPIVLPLIDIAAGVKFNFNDYASLRLEAGVHDLFFVGATLGATI